MIVLASTSATRRALLEAAGVSFEAVAPMIDEDSVKASLRADGLNARDLADALAELKALRVSASRSGTIVLGCDQTLALDDGTMLDKPGTELAQQLRTLSGRTHSLYSAVVAAENGYAVWRHVERATLTVRPLSDAFIDNYIIDEGDAVAGCVGGYRIEGRGIQLFSRIEGAHSTILGLPLLAVMAWLRQRGLMAS